MTNGKDRRERIWASMMICFISPLILIDLYNEFSTHISLIIGAWNIIVLLFVPGHCLLRLTSVDLKGIVQNVILTVCLSIVFLFILMATISITAILLGSLPIENYMYRITLFSAHLLLILISSRWGRKVNWGVNLTANEIRPILQILMLPPIAVVSAFVLNVHGNNSLQIITIMLAAALVPVIAYYGKGRPSICLAGIFSMSFSLLLMHSLISPFIVEWADLTFEFWAAERILTVGYWDPTLFDGVNGLLSVSVLPAALTVASGIGLTTIFKVVFSALFCLVPMGVFCMFHRVLGIRSAFLGAALLICLPSFYTEMLGLVRQQVAELFLLALLLVILHGKGNRNLLAVLLCAGIVVSHYTISILSASIFIFSFLLLFMYERMYKVEIENRIMVSYLYSGIVIGGLSLVYYALISGGYIANLLLIVGTSSIADTTGSLLLSESAFGIITTWLMVYALVVPTLIVISIGGLMKILQLGCYKVLSYYPLIICGSIILVMALMGFDNRMIISSGRLTHIAILLCGTPLIVGITILVKQLFHKRKSRQVPYICVGLIISGMLLVNTGLASYAVEGEQSFVFNPNPVLRTMFTSTEVGMAIWAQSHVQLESMIHGDANMAYLFQIYMGSYHPFYGMDSVSRKQLQTGEWVVLGGININGKVFLENPSNPRLDKSITDMDLGRQLLEMGGYTIYDSGSSKMLLLT